MPSQNILFYAVKDGHVLYEYLLKMPHDSTERDMTNEFRIKFLSRNGDGFFLYINKNDFAEFTRQCQKMLALGIFEGDLS